MNAAEINKRLQDSLADQVKVYPCHNLRASNLGHVCERYLYLLLTSWEEQKPHDSGLQSIFNLGNSLEAFTLQTIKAAGYEVVTPAGSRGGNFKIENPLITGREDVRIKDENGELLPVEIKGLSPVEWSKLNTVQDFFRSKKHYIRAYPAQLQIYLYRFEKEKGFFALTNKLTGQVKFIEMPFDYGYCESLLQKAERVDAAVESGTPPEACEDFSVCENCSLQHVCDQCRRVPAYIDVDGDLDALIAKKQELAPSKRQYDDIDAQIKRIVGERQKIITGNYLVERKPFVKKAYTVPESTQYRITIKKL